MKLRRNTFPISIIESLWAWMKAEPHSSTGSTSLLRWVGGSDAEYTSVMSTCHHSWAFFQSTHLCQLLGHTVSAILVIHVHLDCLLLSGPSIFFLNHLFKNRRFLCSLIGSVFSLVAIPKLWKRFPVVAYEIFIIQFLLWCLMVQNNLSWCELGWVLLNRLGFCLFCAWVPQYPSHTCRYLFLLNVLGDLVKSQWLSLVWAQCSKSSLAAVSPNTRSQHVSLPTF